MYFFCVNSADIIPKIKIAWQQDGMTIKGYIVNENIIIFYNEGFERLSYDFYSLQKTLLYKLIHYISKKSPQNEKEKRRETLLNTMKEVFELKKAP